MANFAELDSNNKVIQTLDVDDRHCGGPDDTGDTTGQNFLRKAYLNPTAVWKRTSPDPSFRGRFASKGLTYDPVKDKFIPPKVYPSWILNETTYTWESPTPKPESGLSLWDEDSQSWLTEQDPDTGIWS